MGEGAPSFGNVLTEMFYLYSRPRLSDSYVLLRIWYICFVITAACALTPLELQSHFGDNPLEF